MYAMIGVTTNVNEVVINITAKMDKLVDTDKMLRDIATTTHGMMRARVHGDGIASDGSQIGTYSDEYMKVRTGQGFKSPVIARGDYKGYPRPRYNRTSDTKVVASLTRQMENDMKVVPTEDNGYAIGYSNSYDFDKSQWVEETYKKDIFGLSEPEKEVITEVAERHLQDSLNGV
jgi:hypothetical protein